MAPTTETISKRLSSSSDVGYDISNKLYRVVQLLPSAVFEYGSLAGQILYIAANLEQINSTLPKLNLANESQLLKDIEKVLDFSDDAYVEVKEALPQRQYDGGEVDLLLPFDIHALEDQVEALQVASTLVVAILQLGAATPSSDAGPSFVPTSSRFAEAVVNQVKRAVRDLKCSQPKEAKRRGVALKRAKTHTAITAFIDTLLTASALGAAQEHAGDDNNSEKKTEGGNEDEKDKEKEKDKVKAQHSKESPEERELVKLEHFNADPKDDGMPDHLYHNPDNVYAKVHVNDVDTRSLAFYNLPYSKAKENPNFYIIWKPMEAWECENLFQHTKKLRINEQHAVIYPKVVINTLLVRWLGVEAPVADAEDKSNSSSDFEELDKNLEELRAQDEKRKSYERPFIRDRSFSPPPTTRERLPPPRRVPRYRGDRLNTTSKTEYWRSWGGQTATLNNALKFAGWQPTYMRGTDAGQTWFYGPDVIHVRRFTDEYTPQDGNTKAENDSDGAKESSSGAQEYLIIGSEWVEEEALIRNGFQFQLLPSGHYSLDSRLTWGDIDLLVYASGTFREERLYRKFRTSDNGDLFEPRHIAVPHTDYLNGSPIVERFKTKAPTPLPRHVPHRLENLPEEPAENIFSKKQEVVTPSLESHDSFVEVSR